jgi:hypothetical protein
MVATTPYVEYKYQIKDDEESVYTSLGDDVTHEFDNPIPKNNAKRLYLRASVPDDAETEGGLYLRCTLRILYTY